MRLSEILSVRGIAAQWFPILVHRVHLGTAGSADRVRPEEALW
jgi:hypothetical protein